MPRKFKVHRDQQVWERETFQIEVPDDVPEDEVEDWIKENLDQHGKELFDPFILSDVNGADLEYEIDPV